MLFRSNVNTRPASTRLSSKKPKKPKKWNAAKSKRKMDKLFSKLIHLMDHNLCQRCGKSYGKLDTSHCIPRECLYLRWNTENAILLCPRCHKFGSASWHKSPLEATLWFNLVFEERNFRLVQLKHQGEGYVFDEPEALRIESFLETQIKNYSTIEAPGTVNRKKKDCREPKEGQNG